MAARVIAFANQKGGVGKTTTTINLAACLAERRRRVLIIDVDPQANATSGLGCEKAPGQSIYLPLIGEGRLEDRIQRTALDRLDLVPAEVDLAGAEVDIARADNYLHRLRQVLEGVRHGGAYDFILIDCPPSLGILTMNALTAADALLLPIQCEYYALEGLGVMKSLIEKIRASGANPGLEIEGILMTMYDGRTNLSRQVVEEVRAHFPDKAYETIIPRSVRLGEAPSHGQPIIAYEPRSSGAVAYRLLAREFLGRRKASDTPPAVEPAPPAVEPHSLETPIEPAPPEASGPFTI